MPYFFTLPIKKSSIFITYPQRVPLVHNWGVQILNAIAQFLSRVDSIGQALVAQKLDCANHQINHYPADSAIDFVILFWIVIYLVDSAIQHLNNWAQTVI